MTVPVLFLGLRLSVLRGCAVFVDAECADLRLHFLPPRGLFLKEGGFSGAGPSEPHFGLWRVTFIERFTSSR